ncbi:hypothetical protein, partial [Escherichia coli]|uniref:hypothetical protein n=1 Tax=Escherichia coli TaxID=562 RepID=UPI00201D0192
MKHCCKNVVILMPEPVAEPALNGLRLNLRIVSIVDSIGQRNSYVKTWGCGGFLNETNI